MTALQELLKTIVSLQERAPAPTQPADLDDLFQRLAAATLADARGVENEIWAAWARHPDGSIQRRLESATRAIAREDYPRARQLLDPLVRDQPQWAEAWNRRATLSYLEGRDAESFADIERTLQLEPRHFGAICGFAQVCLRRGERGAALTAFEVALGINPHLSGVRAAVEDLQDSVGESLH